MNESNNCSRFFIRSKNESIYGLTFEKKDPEVLYFIDEYLQEKAIEMTITKLSANPDNCLKELAETIKNIFELYLFNNTDNVIYISVFKDSAKDKLINRYVEHELHMDFDNIKIHVGRATLYFIYNSTGSKTIDLLISINNFLFNEYGIQIFKSLFNDK